MRRRLAEERGQAAVELIGVLPALLVCAAILLQLVLAGGALWAAAHAARSAARAAVVGRDPGRAARDVLPRPLERGLEVAREGGAVRVRVRVPLLVPVRGSPLRVSAAAGLGVPP